MAQGTITRNSWADLFLTDLGDQPNAQSEADVVEWEAGEGGAGPQFGVPNNIASYNPLNTTQPEPGSVGTPGNNPPVQAYTSWGQGLAATVATLQQGQKGYSQILADLSSGAPLGTFGADVDTSAWGTHDLPTSATGPESVNAATSPASSSSSSASSATPTTAQAELTSATTTSTGASGLLGSILGGLFGTAEASILDVALTLVLVAGGIGLIILGLSRLFPSSHLSDLPLVAAAA
jgi:hypothetical protein